MHDLFAITFVINKRNLATPSGSGVRLDYSVFSEVISILFNSEQHSLRARWVKWKEKRKSAFGDMPDEESFLYFLLQNVFDVFGIMHQPFVDTEVLRRVHMLDFERSSSGYKFSEIWK